MFNKTKIIATIGPASRSQSEMRAMISAGADVFRINGSYEDPVHHAKTIAAIRTSAAREKAATKRTEILGLDDVVGTKLLLSSTGISR